MGFVTNKWRNFYRVSDWVRRVWLCYVKPSELCHMNESTVPLSRALALAGWTISTLLLIAAWIAYGVGYDHLAVLLGLTGMPFIASAALATIQGWASRICRIIHLSAARDPANVAPFR